MPSKSKESSYTIVVCANGYEVFPASTHNACVGGGYATDRHVFESFDRLTAWLKDNLKQPESP